MEPSNNPWAEMDIPDDWTSTAILQNMVADRFGPDKSFDGPLDRDTRDRMMTLAVLGHIELAAKVNVLMGLVQQIADRQRSGS